jgi:hypothetical protein
MKKPLDMSGWWLYINDEVSLCRAFSPLGCWTIAGTTTRPGAASDLLANSLTQNRNQAADHQKVSRNSGAKARPNTAATLLGSPRDCQSLPAHGLVSARQIDRRGPAQVASRVGHRPWIYVVIEIINVRTLLPNDKILFQFCLNLHLPEQ